MATLSINAPESIFGYLASKVYAPILKRDLKDPFLAACNYWAVNDIKSVTPDRLSLKIINDILLPLQATYSMVTLAGVDFNRSEVLNQLRARGHSEVQVPVEQLVDTEVSELFLYQVGVLSTFALASHGRNGIVTYSFTAVSEPKRKIEDGRFVDVLDEDGKLCVDYYTNINVSTPDVIPALGYEPLVEDVLTQDALGSLILKIITENPVVGDLGNAETEALVQVIVPESTPVHETYYSDLVGPQSGANPNTALI